MPDWISKNGIEYPDATPTGAAGLVLKSNFELLADRALTSVCCGRLSVISGEPVPQNEYNQTVLYYTPYKGNEISLYDDADEIWKLHTFSEISLKATDTQTGSLTSSSPIVTGLTDTSQFQVGMIVTAASGIPGSTTISSIDSSSQVTLNNNATASGSASLTFELPSAKNYDVFVFLHGGSLKLELVSWTNDSTRATSLTLQDGVYVKSGSPEHRYLGSIRTSGVGVLADYSLGRFVWNFYNRVPRQLQRYASQPHTYGPGSWRAWNNSANSRVYLFQGMSEDPVEVTIMGEQQTSAYISFGVDSNSAVGLGNFSVGTPDFGRIGGAATLYMPTIGYHYIYVLESGGDASSFFKVYWLTVQFPG